MVLQHEDIKRFKERDPDLQALEEGDTISPNNFFDTPKDMLDLQKRLMNYTSSERSVAMVGAMLAWNLACKITNK